MGSSIVYAGDVVMKTEEIVKITRKRVADLVKARTLSSGPGLFAGHEKRKHTRWPFPGAVELSPVEDDGRTRWFATCGNVSLGGLGIISERCFENGTALEISCHLPEMTLVGQATVCHSEEIPQGYIVGLKFNFDE
jgi:hypothetical protein